MDQTDGSSTSIDKINWKTFALPPPNDTPAKAL